jgi:hypothetical protein
MWASSEIPSGDSPGPGAPVRTATRSIRAAAAVTGSPRLRWVRCWPQDTGHDLPWLTKQQQELEFPSAGGMQGTAWRRRKTQSKRSPGYQKQLGAFIFALKGSPGEGFSCLFWILVTWSLRLSEITNISHPTLSLTQNEHKINNDHFSLLLFKEWPSYEKSPGPHTFKCTIQNSWASSSSAVPQAAS